MYVYKTRHTSDTKHSHLRPEKIYSHGLLAYFMLRLYDTKCVDRHIGGCGGREWWLVLERCPFFLMRIYGSINVLFESSAGEGAHEHDEGVCRGTLTLFDLNSFCLVAPLFANALAALGLQHCVGVVCVDFSKQ